MAQLYYKSGSSWINGTLNMAYPVGALYQSFSSTSPATLFGGTWSQISNRVIRAASNTSTGGADTISHSHWMPIGKENGLRGLSATWLNANGSYQIRAGRWNHSVIEMVDLAASSNATEMTTYTASTDNLPAYQNCYIWRRTA